MVTKAINAIKSWTTLSKVKLGAVAVIIALVLSLSVMILHKIQQNHYTKFLQTQAESDKKMADLEAESRAHELRMEEIHRENEGLRLELKQVAREAAEAKEKTEAGKKEIQRVKDKINSDLSNFTIPTDILEQCQRACQSAKQLGLLDESAPCECKR